MLFGGVVVSTGEDYTYEGTLSSGIAYLQDGTFFEKIEHQSHIFIGRDFTGSCDYNGESCTTLEMTLTNSACEGCGSSSDISLITPLVFLFAA